MTTSWKSVKEKHLTDPAAQAGYAAAQLAFELGARVRAMREERGWSQRDLASRVGMSQPAVARFEAGGTTPTLAVLERFAAAFDSTLTVELRPKSVA